MKQNILSLLFALFSITVFSQEIVMQNGSSTTCSGTFLDSGEIGNYGNNEDYTFTICPDSPVEKTKLAFSQFELQNNMDFLYVYDGSSTNANLIGSFTGNTILNTITASMANTTGCLTLRFVSNASGVAAGWNASVSCAEPFQATEDEDSAEVCSEIKPFCAGDEQLVFPNSHDGNSNQSNAENGPDYGCLGSEPYPAWFYLQIDEPGNLNFTLSQNTSPDMNGTGLDVDFIMWGPFDDYEQCDNLTAANEVDCSYSWISVEDVNIPNAQTGEIYIVVITNYSQDAGYISLEQTGGTGSTDCSILDPALGEDIDVCEGFGPIEIDGTTENASSYQWGVLNETTGDYEDIAGETNPFITVTETGTYQVTTYDAANDDYANANITVTYHEVPVATEIEDDTVCVESFPTSVDLFPYNASILGDLDPVQFDLSYHATQANADAGSNALGNLPFSEEGCSTEYVRIEKIDLNEC